MLLYKFSWPCNLVYLLAIVFLSSSTIDHSTAIKKRFRIEYGSRLYLKGTSNVNSFTCDCQDQYEGQILDVERNGNHASFRNVELKIKSKNFDCHNRKIDSDMQKALQADQHPYIRIALINTWQNAKCLEGACHDWFDVQAKVNITITTTTKEFSIPAKARVLGPNRFQLRGESALQMSTFGITPPEAMFGMIKVNDWITFNFDLIVAVDEVY